MIIKRLSGKPKTEEKEPTLDVFLATKFDIPDLEKLPIEGVFKPIIKQRLDEIERCYDAQAYLASIILIGSVIEAVLLGAAITNRKQFSEATGSPKTAVEKWNLSSLIDVATEIGMLKKDVGKFSQTVREFRNYVHPFQEASPDFKLDRHTARICCQVLMATLASVAGER